MTVSSCSRKRSYVVGIVILAVILLLIVVCQWQPRCKKLDEEHHQIFKEHHKILEEDHKTFKEDDEALEEDHETFVRSLVSSRSESLSINLVIIPYLHYPHATEDALARRKEEYRTALRRNLNHSLVSNVHVLTTNAQETWELIRGLPNQHKLTVSEVNSTAKMRDPFEYISQNLAGKDVMFSNADIYLGDGFHRVDADVMRQQKIMYSLTRSVAPQERCRNKPPKGIPALSSGRDMCRSKYQNSHDAFLLHLDEPLPENALKELDYNVPRGGMENVLMWVFQTKLNYCVLNPCSILKVFHLHCSYVRNIKSNAQDRVDDGRKGVSPFTRHLTCSG